MSRKVVQDKPKETDGIIFMGSLRALAEHLNQGDNQQLAKLVNKRFMEVRN